MRGADLFDQNYTMHPFRVGGALSQQLAGTPVDAIMRLIGWKTRSVAERYTERQRLRATPKRNESIRSVDKRWPTTGNTVGIRPREPIAVDTAIPAGFCRIQVSTYVGGIYSNKV